MKSRTTILNAFSRLARKNTTNQNLLWQNFIAYIFRSKSASPPLPTSLGARAPERQSARAPERRARALLFTSLGAREQAQSPKRKRNPLPLKESYPLPRTYHSLIGCSPWPSWRHGKDRVHGVEKYPWHMRRLFVYHLEHRMSTPSCDGECGGGSQQ